MANLFDDLFENKRLFEKKELFQQYQKTLQEIKNENVEELSDSDFEQLLMRARANPEKLLTEKETELLLKKKEDNKKLGEVTLNRIINLKDRLKREVDIMGGFTLDISKKEKLRNHSNAIFGNNKSEITFDDYMALIEMRKILENKDSEELFIGEFE